MENRDCEKILELLNQYIDGELSADDAEFARAHIEKCSSCKKAYDELLKIEKLFEDATEEVPTELCEAVMSEIKNEKAARKIRFTKMFGGVAIAAAITLTVLASPAILMVATGGAKSAEDMAEALSPSMGNAGADNYYSDVMSPECVTAVDQDIKNDSLQDIMDIFDSLRDGDDDKTTGATVGEGKMYTAYLSDGSETTIIFTQNTAILGGKEYEYKLDDGQYILTDREITLVFDRVLKSSEGGEIYFKQSEKTND